MADETTTKPVVRTERGTFAPGTGRPSYSGAPKGSKLRRLDVIIAEMEAKLCRNCDPVVTLLELGSGHDALAERELARHDPELVALVKAKHDWRVVTADNMEQRGYSSDEYAIALALRLADVPRDVRIDAAKAASRFARPVLAATEVSGPDKGAIPIAQFPLGALMKDDESRRLLENMQIAIAEEVRKSTAQELVDEEDAALAEQDAAREEQE
jgi:hypothetical protein